MNDNRGGSYQSAISKKVLSKLPIPNVSIDKQNLITEAASSVKKKVYLHQQLIKSREQEIDSVFSDVWKGLI